MSGDVTYQALKRLSYLPDRDALDNGNVIAGQEWDDIYFGGGNAANLILTNATVNGLVYNASLIVQTTAGNVTMLPTDNVVIVKKTVPEVTTISLPASPSTNQFAVIKDGDGTANVYNITIDGNGNLIDGGATLIIGASRGWNQLIWDGAEWNIIG